MARICAYCGKEIKPGESWTESPVGSGKYWHSECLAKAKSGTQTESPKHQTEPKACAANYRTFWVVIKDLKDALYKDKWGYAKVRLADLHGVIERLEKYCGIDLNACYRWLRTINECIEKGLSFPAILTLSDIEKEVERKIEG